MKISIITVVRNGAGTIAGALQSVADQDWPEVEHIVVDGASTDGTVEEIRRFAALRPGSVRWISEPDRGLYDAMNKGIAMATGEVVGILNADDFYHRPDALHLVARAFEADPQLRGVYADVRMVSPGDPSRVVRRYSSGHFRPWMFRLGMMPAHPTFFTYRSTFGRYGLYRTDMSISADFEMLLRLIRVNRLTVRHLPQELLTMRAGGLSDSGMAAKMEINRQILRALRLHGIGSCLPLLWCRYPVKLLQFLRH